MGPGRQNGLFAVVLWFPGSSRRSRMGGTSAGTGRWRTRRAFLARLPRAGLRRPAAVAAARPAGAGLPPQQPLGLAAPGGRDRATARRRLLPLRVVRRHLPPALSRRIVPAPGRDAGLALG